MPHVPVRHVFVYGTLRRGGSNDITRLRPAPRLVGSACVPGVLYQIAHYPGLCLGGADAVPVTGEVYAIEPALEAVLDAIEGIEPGPHSEYFKRDVTITVQGHPLRCLVYEINPDRVRGRRRIPEGDWMDFVFRNASSTL